eukprot:scaffold475_cov279-Pinguiococcus_pyrenoidosus.AAC.4
MRSRIHQRVNVEDGTRMVLACSLYRNQGRPGREGSGALGEEHVEDDLLVLDSACTLSFALLCEASRACEAVL